MSDPSKSADLAILMPTFNDWDTVLLLLPRLNATFANRGLSARVIVVNDGSVAPLPAAWPPDLRQIVALDVIHLRRNLGHQRAIAVGLVWAHAHLPGGSIVVMDSDGQDRPEDIPALLDRFDQDNGERVVFAARSRRSENVLFRVFYHLYRAVHYLLTGISVRVGNFSVLPRRTLSRLVVSSDLWNHYAAAVFRSRARYELVPISRGERLRGESRMNFPGLVVHGLSAISVFADIVGARLLVASLGVAALSLILIGVVAIVKFQSGLAIPGWATNSTGFLLLMLSQAVMLSFLLVFSIVGSRGGGSFLPIRDGEFFIDSVEQVWPTS